MRRLVSLRVGSKSSSSGPSLLGGSPRCPSLSNTLQYRALSVKKKIDPKAPAPLPVSRDEWWGKEAGSKEATLTSKPMSLRELKAAKKADIMKLSEWIQMDKFLKQLEEGNCAESANPSRSTLAEVGCTPQEALLTIDAAFMTMAIHLESRIAALVGQGFYTIGPAGEELMAVIGSILRPTDGMALHYRHLAAQIARQLTAGRSVEEVMLDRARGHVVSIKDPVTGGNHCAIGGGPYDFLVTSTLATQAPPAVGRALATGLASVLKVPCLFPKDSVSFVSVGDGSVNHAFYLSALNLAEYSRYRQFKCPIVFAITDNDVSISLPGYGWLQNQFIKKLQMPVFTADANDLLDLWAKTKAAVDSARLNSQPVAIVYKNIPRRFGHAATDRQAAYYTEAQIQAVANRNPVEHACRQLVDLGVVTYAQLAAKLRNYLQRAEDAFEEAVVEPKITRREQVTERTSRPLAPVTTTLSGASSDITVISGNQSKDIVAPAGNEEEKKGPIKEVMRKHMTLAIDEAMAAIPNLVYIGEDVVHGGYYLVTDGLAKKYPVRVRDFPPEETALIGVGMGFAQAGLLPIVEIPYAKYLDCGADMFFEAALMNWLSNHKQPNGMIFRLQGFGRGVFGGNFHTHNMLHIPPGIDVVCYSNGPDWARGFRYALKQAQAGRVVMLVDCTNLLNQRHLHTSGDRGWSFEYTKTNEFLPFSEVGVYKATAPEDATKIAVVCYGNSVPLAVQAKEILKEELGIDHIAVIDCPYLSSVPSGLAKEITNYEGVVFADDCKKGNAPLAQFVTSLQSDGLLPSKWRLVAAEPTYNPLGTAITFTNADDIIDACLVLLNKRRKPKKFIE